MQEGSQNTGTSLELLGKYRFYSIDIHIYKHMHIHILIDTIILSAYRYILIILNVYVYS